MRGRSLARGFLASVLPATLVFLFFLTVYLRTLTQVHTFDALSYILDVDRKPWQELFHPHHLAYGPLGVLVRGIAQGLGYAGSAALPLQVTNALAGALGVALFFALVRSVSRRYDLALGAALILASSYAFWYYAVEVEVYTVAVLFLIACLWMMLRLSTRPTPGLCAALGALQGLAVLFHQTNVLLCVPALCAILLVPGSVSGPSAARRQPHIPNVQHLLAYALPLALIVGGSYLFVGFGVSGFRSWDEWLNWMLKYPRTGWWGGPITGSKWASLGLGLGETFAQPGGALLGLLLAGLLLAYGRGLAQTRTRLLICLGAWLLSYGVFFFWWEPDNIEFWIASLPPALVLLALALGNGGPRRHPGVWLMLAVGVTMFGVNYDTIVRRGTASYDVQRLIATGLAQQSRPDDLLLVPDGLQELYLPYYEGRNNILSLNQALFESGAAWPEACATVRARVELTLRSGAAVLIGDEVLRPGSTLDADGPAAGGRGRGGVLERFGLTQAQVSDCFSPYAPDLLPVEIGAGLPLYYRLPSAQELADGAGWRFVGQAWGWRAANMKSEQLGAGWEMTPGVDPFLLSPPIRIDTARFAALELRMTASTAARDAQLFFIDERGQTDETRAVRWTLQPGTAVQTYRIELRGRPGWSGTVIGLRLDPVGVGDGGWVRVEALRLVPQ